MLRSRKTFWWVGHGRFSASSVVVSALAIWRDGARAGVTSEEVEHAIREGVRFLKEKQGT